MDKAVHYTIAIDNTEQPTEPVRTPLNTHSHNPGILEFTLIYRVLHEGILVNYI